MKNQLVLVVICSTLTATLSGCGRSTASPPPAVAGDVAGPPKPAEPVATSLPAFNRTVDGFAKSLSRLGYEFKETLRDDSKGITKFDAKVGLCAVKLHAHSDGIGSVDCFFGFETDADLERANETYQDIVAQISETVQESARARNWLEIALKTKNAELKFGSDMRPDEVPSAMYTVDLTTYRIKLNNVLGVSVFTFEAKPR